MSNSYYSPTGAPSFGAFGHSVDMRNQFALIEQGFDKLPSLTATYIVRVKSDGTGLESVSTATLASAIGLELPTKATFEAQGSVATPSANKGVMYVKLVSGIPELFYKDDDGREIQFTTAGNLNVSIPDSALAPQSVAATTTVTAGQSIAAPIVKTSPESVSISAGNVSLNLDQATVFYVTVTENCSVTFTASDMTKTYSFSVVATTTGAYDFTSLTMSGVDIYYGTGPDGTINLQPSGRTVLGCLFNGATMELDVFRRWMDGPL